MLNLIKSTALAMLLAMPSVTFAQELTQKERCEIVTIMVRALPLAIVSLDGGATDKEAEWMVAPIISKRSGIDPKDVVASAKGMIAQRKHEFGGQPVNVNFVKLAARQHENEGCPIP